MGAVVRFCEYLAKEEKILVNPAATIELPKRPRRLFANYLSCREMNRLLKTPDLSTHLGVRNRAILEVLYATGIRNSELRNCKIEDVNLKDGWLTIRSGKGGGERVVPLGKAALHFLGAWMLGSRSRLHQSESSDYLFLSKMGGKLEMTTLNAIIGKAAAAARIKRKVTAHAIRHTCATAMLRGRADIRWIGELLGHASLASTQIYTRVEIADLKRIHHQCHPREKEAIDKA
jgi:integrase/recombinase XerD